MTKGEGKSEVIDLKGLLGRDEDFVRTAVEALVQAALEAEMTEAIGAAKGERTETRLSSLMIDRAPLVHMTAGDPYDHFVEMPAIARSRTGPPQSLSDRRSECEHP